MLKKNDYIPIYTLRVMCAIIGNVTRRRREVYIIAQI